MTPRPARSQVGLAVALAMTSVALSAAPRIALAAGVLPSGARAFIWSDVYATYVEELQGGKVPYVDTFFDYPPGIGYLAGIFVRIASGPVAYVVLWAAVAMVSAGVVALLLARESTPARALRFWSLSPQLLLYGGANFDAFAVLFVVAGVVLARQRRAAAAFAVLGAGTVVKLFPLVAALPELERLRRSRGWRRAAIAATTFVAVLAVLALPSLLAAHPAIEGVTMQGARTNFDSVWGLVLAALQAAGVPGAPTIVVAASAIGLAATFVVVLRRSEPRADAAALALLAILALLLWSRLYSPQYTLWVLPLLALAGPSRRALAILSVADVVVFATVYPLTLVAWPADAIAPTILFGVLAVGIVARHIGLIVAWRAVALRV